MKIDVIIPSFNSSKYLAHSIKSVLAQGTMLGKLIIIDDGSTDDTKIIVSKFQKKHSNIKYVYQNNSGLSSARNAGIKHSKAEYIAFLDADDVWAEDKLEKQLSVFEESKFNNLGLVYCNYKNIDVRGKEINKMTFVLKPNIRGNVYDEMKNSNHIASSGSGVLIKNECFDKVGLFDETLTAAEDWDMWLRISEIYDVDYVNERLVQIRHHKKNMQKNIDFMIKNYGIFYAKRNKENNLTKISTKFIKRKIIQYSFSSRERSINKAKKYFSIDTWEKIWKNKMDTAFEVVIYLLARIKNGSIDKSRQL